MTSLYMYMIAVVCRPRLAGICLTLTALTAVLSTRSE